MRPHLLRPPLFIAILTVLLMSACKKSGQEKRPADEQHTANGQFGDPYRIVNNFHDSYPDVIPQFHQDTLVAKVTYTGGCKDHDFDLRSDVARDTAKLWIKHDAHGDDCEAEVQDEVRQTVSDDVLEAPVIVLLDPNGGPPHIIKWGKQ